MKKILSSDLLEECDSHETSMQICKTSANYKCTVEVYC